MFLLKIWKRDLRDKKENYMSTLSNKNINVTINSIMNYRISLTFLCISSLSLFTPFLQAQPIVPIQITDEGHILVKAKINGVEGNFIFDTGGGLTLCTETFAAKVSGLVKQDGSFTVFRATGEKIDLDMYSAKELTIGNYTQKAFTLTIIDADFGEIDGLISLMSFQHQPFTIDFEQKKIFIETKKNVSKRKKTGFTIPLQLETGRDKALDIFAYFTVNNKLTLQFCLDSGAGNDVFRINSKFMLQLGIDTTRSQLVVKTQKQSEFNPNYKTSIYKATVSKLSAKDNIAIKKENFTAHFIDGLIYDGVVSINWIGRQITFDLGKSEMIVLRN